MLHDVFGEITFNVGWKTKRNIKFFGKDYSIILKIQAYYEEDGITAEQETAYLEFSKAETDKLKKVEKLLVDYSETAELQFEPKTLLFNRDGSYALLCDDKDDPDGGIVVCLSPEETVVSQDDYL